MSLDISLKGLWMRATNKGSLGSHGNAVVAQGGDDDGKVFARLSLDGISTGMVCMYLCTSIFPIHLHIYPLTYLPIYLPT